MTKKEFTSFEKYLLIIEHKTAPLTLSLKTSVPLCFSFPHSLHNLEHILWCIIFFSLYRSFASQPTRYSTKRTRGSDGVHKIQIFRNTPAKSEEKQTTSLHNDEWLTCVLSSNESVNSHTMHCKISSSTRDWGSEKASNRVDWTDSPSAGRFQKLVSEPNYE